MGIILAKGCGLRLQLLLQLLAFLGLLLGGQCCELLSKDMVPLHASSPQRLCLPHHPSSTSSHCLTCSNDTRSLSSRSSFIASRELARACICAASTRVNAGSQKAAPRVLAPPSAAAMSCESVPLARCSLGSLPSLSDPWLLSQSPPTSAQCICEHMLSSNSIRISFDKGTHSPGV